MSNAYQEVIDVNAGLLNALQENDIAKTAEFYAEDAYILFFDEPIIRGKEAIAGLYQQAIQAGEIDFKFTSERLTVSQSGDLAVDIGHFKYGLRDGSDTPTEGKYMVSWGKQKSGDWKMTAEMMSLGY